MAEITDKKDRKLEWYKYVVKRYLRDILQDMAIFISAIVTCPQS